MCHFKCVISVVGKSMVYLFSKRKCFPLLDDKFTTFQTYTSSSRNMNYFFMFAITVPFHFELFLEVRTTLL